MILELPPFEPAEQQPVWDYEIDLPLADGTSNPTYRLVIQWCERTESWYLSLYDADGVLQAGRRRLSADWRLGWMHQGRFPSGGFLVFMDAEGLAQEATYASLGHRHRLVWATSDEFAEESTGYPITIVKVT